MTKQKINDILISQGETMSNNKFQQEETRTITEKEYNNAPLVVVPELPEDAELKNIIIDYTGLKFQPEDGKVDINMIAELLASEFPEFIYAFAEQNFIRGYQLGLEDATTLPTRETEEAESTEE